MLEFGIYMFQDVQSNAIVILTPIEGSPAEKAGILPGDIIKKVDGVEYSGEDFEKISACIKGKAGTTVKLTIERNGKELEFELERKNIDIYPIKSEVLENNIGYINISSFDEDCAKDFKNAYTELNKKNIKSLIIDLRNNGGGIVEETLQIAEYILDKNQIILITKDKDGNEEIEKATKKPIINMPIVVLTNENTASASEILTAALKENEKAVIVGETTYGKGVIQELITLKDGSGIKITTEEYYTPNRNKINKVGIEPNKEVSLPEEIETSYNIKKEDDAQLQEAINILKNK
jgi:carboxyl-terminal processing protease